jgi:hypothetical protein
MWRTAMLSVAVPARSDALRVLVRLPLVDARVVHERRRDKPGRLAEEPASSRRLIPSDQ